MKGTVVTTALITLLSTIYASAALGQQLLVVDTRAQNFQDLLGFEVETGSELPAPWITYGNVTLDREIFRTGNSAAKIVLSEGESILALAIFQSLLLRIPVDFTGTSIELRGYRRADNFPGRTVQRDSTDWAEFSVTAPLDPNVHTLELGIPVISGQGTIWVDDLEILIDGRPLQDVRGVAKVMTDLEIEELIARAERAGHQSITNSATIKTVYGGEIKILRDGSNGWVCWAEPLREEPMCNEPGWDAWLMAYWNQHDSFEVDRFSTSYMLAGRRPHIMTLVPNAETLEGLPPFPPVYAMFEGTPYAHIMLETGQEGLTDLDAGNYGPSRTQQIVVPDESIIPTFEPIEMSMATLERYTGTYVIDVPAELRDELPANVPVNFEPPTVTVAASAEGLLIEFPLPSAGSPGAGSPTSPVLSADSESSSSVPRRFVAFASRYHPRACFAPSGDDASPSARTFYPATPAPRISRWKERDLPGSWTTLVYMPRSWTPADRLHQAFTMRAILPSAQLTTSAPRV